MLVAILLLQIILPMVSIIFESEITLISRAEGDTQININTLKTCGISQLKLIMETLLKV